MKRILRALKFNEPQRGAVITFTALNIAAVTYRMPDNLPVWFYIVVILFWPTIAFVANLIDPP